jgi:type II secretory pathway component PulM
MPTTLDLIILLAGFLCGCACMWFVRSRPTTTRSQAMKALQLQAELVAKMPGATQDKARAEAEMAQEELQAKALADAMAKLGGPQS